MNPLNIPDDARQARHLSALLGQLAAKSRTEPPQSDAWPPSMAIPSRLPDVLAHFLRRNWRREDVQDKLRGQQLMAD
jgi:hypothetical protein